MLERVRCQYAGWLCSMYMQSPTVQQPIRDKRTNENKRAWINHKDKHMHYEQGKNMKESHKVYGSVFQSFKFLMESFTTKETHPHTSLCFSTSLVRVYPIER